MQSKSVLNSIKMCKNRLKSRLVLAFISFIFSLLLFAKFGNAATSSYAYFLDFTDNKYRVRIFDTHLFREVDVNNTQESITYSSYNIAITQDGKKVFFNSSKDGILNFLDPSINKVFHLTLGVIGRDGMAVLPNGKTLYMADSKTNTIVVIDTSTDKPFLKPGIALGLGSNPSNIIASPNGEFIYVSGKYKDMAGDKVKIFVIRAVDNQVVNSILLRNSADDGAALDIYENTLYVAGGYYDDKGKYKNNLSVIDLEGKKPTTFFPSLPLSGAMHTMRVTPDGKFIYFSISDWTTGSEKWIVDKYDLSTITKVASYDSFDSNIVNNISFVKDRGDNYYGILGKYFVDKSFTGSFFSLSFNPIRLNGDFIGPPIKSEVSFSAVPFAEQIVQTPSQPQTITLTDKYVPIDIANPADVTTEGEFKVTEHDCTHVDIGKTCSVKVVFTPTDVGDRTGKLLVTDSTGDKYEVALSGKGIPVGSEPAPQPEPQPKPEPQPQPQPVPQPENNNNEGGGGCALSSVVSFNPLMMIWLVALTSLIWKRRK